MPDLRRISVFAIVFVVLVRMAIGWQFLYEGLWKLDTQDTAKPWTAEGYLKNAKGPFREFFRNLTGDPNDLRWLDYETVAARWDRWHERFLEHHPDLTDEQKRRLDIALNGPPDFRAVLEELPKGVQIGGSLARSVTFDEQRKRLIVDGERHLTARERDILLRLGRVDEDAPEEQKRIAEAYRQAVRTAAARASRLSIKEEARALLRGDPDRATQIYKEHEGTVDYKRVGQIDLYRELLNRYEQVLEGAETDFQYEHLEKLGYPGYGTLPELRAELIGPIKSLEEKLKQQAWSVLDAEQRARGPVPMPMTRMDWIDAITMWSLVTLGILLLAGLLSRVAAVGAVGMLLSFYLAMPPEPLSYGFQELPGPEHSYIVDKNLIEVLALLAIAAMPTGRWFGIDAVLRAVFRRRKKSAKGKPEARREGTAEGSRKGAQQTEKAEGKSAQPAQTTGGYPLGKSK